MNKKVELELSCNTQLVCTECGCQNFRICMDADEKTDEVSTTLVNNVECSACHALFQVNLVRSDPDHPKVGDGTPDAALAIGEDAFKAGYNAAAARASLFYPTRITEWDVHREEAWSRYDPPEDIKALS